MNKNCVFTICAKNYIGLAQLLEKSIKKNNDNIDFFIVVADEMNGSHVSIDENVLIAKDILKIDNDLWINMTFKYNLTEFCTCIKPFSISYFFEDRGYETVCYLDPDIYIFSDLSYIYEKLNTFLVVTAPHITIPDYPYTGDISDRNFLFNGISNFGFVGFRKSEKTLSVVHWWEDRLKTQCFGEPLWAICTDQKWSDFFPAFFSYDECFFSNNLGLNLAPWNYFERKVVNENGVYYVESRRGTIKRKDKLVFCHFAGYNYRQLANDGKADNKARIRINSLKEYDDLNPLIEKYVSEIYNNRELFKKYLDLPYSYGTFDNGIKVESFHRRLYNGLYNTFDFRGNPYQTEASDSFYALLKKKKIFSNEGSQSVDKMNPNNISGYNKKLKFLFWGMRWLFKIVGYNNYVVLLQFFRRMSLYDLNTFLLGKEYENYSLRDKLIP